MSEFVKEIASQEDFNELLADSERVVVDFWATWCGPCARFKPHFELASAQAAKDNLNVVFATIDIDQHPWAVEKYGILSVPTVLLIEKDDVTTVTGRAAVPLLAELKA